MSEPRIDAIARSLAHGLPRRRLLGGLGGGLVAVAGLLALPKSALVCQRVGKTCDRNNVCCHGATCQDGTCACADGWEDCDGTGLCVDRDQDEDHCGRCGRTCAATRFRRTCCGGECVDVEGDRAHCGACGVVCADAELCVRGTCLACPLGTTPCRNVCCAPGRCDAGRCVLGDRSTNGGTT